MIDRQNGENRRILVIDDSSAIHEDFRKILGTSNTDSAVDEAAAALFDEVVPIVESMNFEIDSAYQGQEALERVRQAIAENRPYGVAFVDVRMPPGWDGIETLCRIWEEDPDLLAVICTAYSDHSWEEIVEQLGRTSQFLVLKKPFDTIEVRQLACSLSEKWDQAQAARLKLDEMTRMVELRTRTIREGEVRMQAIMETAADAIIVTDDQGDIQSFNKAAEAVFGHAFDEVQGRNLTTLIPPDLPELRIEKLQELRRSAQEHPPSIHWEVAATRKNGSSFPADLTLTQTRIGQNWLMTAIVRDVTERKQAEIELRMERDFNKGLIEASSAYIVVTTTDGKIRMMNPAMLRALGHGAEEVAGEDYLAACVPEQEHEEVADAIRQLATGKESVTLEHELLTKDGNRLEVAWGAGRALDADGNPDFVFAVGIDITERKRAEQALRESQELLQSMFEAIPDLVVVLDQDLHVVMSNWRDHEYVTEQQRQSQTTCYECFAHRDSPCEDCQAKKVFEEGKVCRAERVNPVNGSVKEFCASPIRDESGKVVMIVEHVRDISERKRNEQILQEYSKTVEDAYTSMRELYVAAKAATRSKSEFLANMSHEIRTPMTAILGFAENLLVPGSSESERISAVETIRRNGEHLLEIINDVLDLSKIEAGKLEIECIACSPSQVAQDVCSLMRNRAEQKGLKLEIDYVTAIPERIQTDPTRLRQVLINLVGNAIKFTDDGHVGLRISFRKEGEPPAPMICYEVIDTGMGMSQEQLDKLFQPFSQGDTSTTRRFGGSGLGLAICHRLVEKLGGSIHSESTPDVGSTFRITITAGPLDGVAMVEHTAGDGSVGTEPTPRTTAAPANQRLAGRVLLAEDAVDNQRLIHLILEKAGAEVVIVENGQIALDRAMEAWQAGEPFGVILMDMQMPILDGYGATRNLRDHDYPGTIIALTAHAMPADRQKCLDAGCNVFISKPIKREQLLAVLADYLGQPAEEKHCESES